MKDHKEIKNIIYQYIIDNRGSCDFVYNVPELYGVDSVCSHCGIDKEGRDCEGSLRCADSQVDNRKWKLGYCKEYFAGEILEML